jgi:hypothetical protein
MESTSVDIQYHIENIGQSERAIGELTGWPPWNAEGKTAFVVRQILLQEESAASMTLDSFKQTGSSAPTRPEIWHDLQTRKNFNLEREWAL